MSSLAGRIKGEFFVVGYGIVMVVGSFAPNAGSAIDNTLNKGKGFTVAFTATGLYTVTLTGSALAFLSGQLTPQFAAATASDLQFRACDATVAAGGTFQIANSPAGSDTNIAANASNRVHFAVFVGVSQLNK